MTILALALEQRIISCDVMPQNHEMNIILFPGFKTEWMDLFETETSI